MVRRAHACGNCVNLRVLRFFSCALEDADILFAENKDHLEFLQVCPSVVDAEESRNFVNVCGNATKSLQKIIFEWTYFCTDSCEKLFDNNDASLRCIAQNERDSQSNAQVAVADDRKNAAVLAYDGNLRII